ncbi:MAG: hypothetical protein Q9177_006978, partial [Variospora cf. flavescens]
MATDGFLNGGPHINGDSQRNGLSAPKQSSQPTDSLSPNGLTHNLKTARHNKKLGSYAAKHKLAPHFIGGNHLDVAPASSVKDFVANNDGHTVITS